MPDELFGYILHPVDLAMNKAMASAGRREVRDVVDLVTIHKSVLSLGAVFWAEWRALLSPNPVDPVTVTTRLNAALDEAEAFVGRMPTEKIGLLFLKDGQVVQPDPDRLQDYQPHAGMRRGHWPGSPEIDAAMLERHDRKSG